MTAVKATAIKATAAKASAVKASAAKASAVKASAVKASSWSHHAYDWTPSVDQVARIRGHTGSDFHSDIAVDDVHVSGAVAGPPPPPPSGPWTYGAAGASCDTTCSDAGQSCHDGDWGAHTQSAMEAALRAAGVDPASHSFNSPNDDSSTPLRSGTFYPASSTTQQCSPSGSSYERLCKCV